MQQKQAAVKKKKKSNAKDMSNAAETKKTSELE